MIPTLAVIIPHYDDPVRLGACLDALAPQLAAANASGGSVEVMVVDNASPCDLDPLRAAHPGLRFVTEPARGAAAARNRGVHETVAPQLAFLDSDCIPAPDWLATARRLAGSADVIGGRIDTFDETPGPRTGAQAFETVFAFRQKAYVARKGFSVTANLLTSRAVFDDVGPLVVGLSEDMDWCRRATAKGYRLVYADDLRVVHPTRPDWQALVKKWRRTTAEGFHLNGAGPWSRLKWAARAGAVLGSSLPHLPRMLAAPGLTPGERLRGAVTLVRLRALRAAWMVGQAARGT